MLSVASTGGVTQSKVKTKSTSCPDLSYWSNILQYLSAAHLLLFGLLPQLLRLQPVLAHLLQISTRDALQLRKLPFGLFLRLHQLNGLLIANLQRQPHLQDVPNTQELVVRTQHSC